MPELPDLVHLERRLSDLGGREIRSVTVKQPVVIRNHAGIGFDSALEGSMLAAVRRHGPFLHFDLLDADRQPRFDLVIHPMLAGRFGVEARTPDAPGSKKVKKAGLCFSVDFGDCALHYLDTKKMGKVYLLPPGKTELVPRYPDQGIDLLGPTFTREAFRERIDASRQQVRVFLMDQTRLSAIGNAYADEILFEAGLHPKTFCYQIDPADRDRLFDAIGSILKWGIEEVGKAGLPMEEKARDHMRVRGRKDEPCPRCDAKIRRAAVLGHDAFFCPACQPAARDQFIDWNHPR